MERKQGDRAILDCRTGIRVVRVDDIEIAVAEESLAVGLCLDRWSCGGSECWS